jgi:hypothetical protein
MLSPGYLALTLARDLRDLRFAQRSAGVVCDYLGVDRRTSAEADGAWGQRRHR